MHKMAAAFNTTLAALEDEIMQLILDGKINARIDSHNKVVSPICFFGLSISLYLLSLQIQWNCTCSYFCHLPDTYFSMELHLFQVLAYTSYNLYNECLLVPSFTIYLIDTLQKNYTSS